MLREGVGRAYLVAALISSPSERSMAREEFADCENGIDGMVAGV